MSDTLELEYRLQIAHRMSCWCSTYLIKRQEALKSAVLKQATSDGRDPENVLAEYCMRLHEKECSKHEQPVNWLLERVREALADGNYMGAGERND